MITRRLQKKEIEILLLQLSDCLNYNIWPGPTGNNVEEISPPIWLANNIQNQYEDMFEKEN